MCWDEAQAIVELRAAGSVVRYLRKRHPELVVEDEDALRAEILAAHDACDASRYRAALRAWALGAIEASYKAAGVPPTKRRVA